MATPDNPEPTGAAGPVSAPGSFRATMLPLILWGGLLVLAVGAAMIVRAGFARHTTGDFYHFYTAAVAMTRGEDIYMSGRIGYIYPPLIAFLFQPLASLSEIDAAWAWFWVSLVLLIGAILVFTHDLCDRFDTPRDQLTVGVIAATGVLLTLDKIRWEFDLGQTDNILLLCFALALRWLDKRPILAGIALGLAANVKYLSIVMLPYLIIRGRWKAAGASVVSFVGFLLLPAVSVGWNTNLHYISSAFGGMRHMMGEQADRGAANISGVTWERSVSVTSSIYRALGVTESTPGVYICLALVVGVMFLAGWWMYRYYGFALFRSGTAPAESRSPRKGLVAIEWVGLVVAALAFSPQTTTRHMELLFVAHALAGVLLFVPRLGVPRWPVVLGVVLMVLALNLPPGHEPFRSMVNAWRAVGGPGWVSLVMFLLILWTGLRYTRAVAQGRMLTDPPPGYADPPTAR